MEIDLHGYHPAEIVFNGTLARIVQQAWEMGEHELTLIHGHGRNRGISPGFVNPNTGYFGLCVRRLSAMAGRSGDGLSTRPLIAGTWAPRQSD